jgi:hypothetical protein
MGWVGGHKAKHLNMGMLKILAKCDDNLKKILKWC